MVKKMFTGRKKNIHHCITNTFLYLRPESKIVVVTLFILCVCNNNITERDATPFIFAIHSIQALYSYLNYILAYIKCECVRVCVCIYFISYHVRPPEILFSTSFCCYSSRKVPILYNNYYYCYKGAGVSSRIFIANRQNSTCCRLQRTRMISPSKTRKFLTF